MALKLQFAFKQGTALETIVMDASINEGHSFSADVTEFPVESGSAVTDNVRPRPDLLKVDAFVADFPLPNEGRTFVSSGAITQRPAAETNRAQNTLDKLIRMKDQGITITVETGIKTYKDMVIQTIDTTRDKSVTGGLRISLLLKQIRIVKTQTVELQKAAEAKGQNKVGTGPQTTKPTPEAEAAKGSLITQIGDGIGLGKVLPK